MAYSYFEVIASGGNTFNIPFDYINQSEISVYVDGVETPFTFTSSYVIDITPAPTTGALVRIERETNLSERAVDFASGAVLTEEDLDESNIQVYHAAQEALDKVEQTMQVDVDGKWDSQNRQIKDVAPPTTDDAAVNRGFITTNLPAINTVEASIDNVNTVSANIADVNTVADDLNSSSGQGQGSDSDIRTVANDIDNVNAVGEDIDNVNTTATNIASVNTTATNITDVNTTANSISSVNSVAGSIGNVNTVATNIDSVNTVATDIDKVIETANDLQEAVSEINTVAGNIVNVNIVGEAIDSVQAVALINEQVIALDDRYYVQSTQPTSGMTQGDLWYDSANNLLYTYTGSGWELTTTFSKVVIRQNDYVATAGQTSFTGADKNGIPLALVDSQTTFVYQNGILIEPTIDYTLNFGNNTVTLLVGAEADDEIRVVSFNPFDSLEFNQLIEFRDDASLSATNASNSVTLANTYQNLAFDYKNLANERATAALVSENNAFTSEANALNSRNDAEKLAVNPEDSQYTLADGTTTGYSALHYAAKAEDSASNALASANVAANPWVVDSGTQNIEYTSGQVQIAPTTGLNGVLSIISSDSGVHMNMTDSDTTGGTYNIVGADGDNVKLAAAHGYGTLTSHTWGTTTGGFSIYATPSKPELTQPGMLALHREGSNPYISFHNEDGTRAGYVQSHADGMRVISESAGTQYLTIGANQGQQMPIITTIDGPRLKFRTADNDKGMTLSTDDLMVYDNVLAGYTRLEDDSGWYYNTGENSISAYSGSSGDVASTTASDCYTSMASRTVADTSEAFNCTVDGNIKIEMDANGTCYNDGTWSTTAADYAEMFEWADGNPNNEDRVGYPVVLEGNKIRIASDSDEPSKIIGIVSASPGVLGDNDLKKWNGWAARDDWGRPVMRDVEMVKWIEDDAGRTKDVRYRVDHLPENITVPDNAVYFTTQETAYNPDWDRSVEYTPRSERQEWDAIGLMGKLRKHKNTPSGDRWIKMRDINENIEEWLVR